jgi:aryl-alcohol dehydrogenase-like predicted oxidoreductase
MVGARTESSVYTVQSEPSLARLARDDCIALAPSLRRLKTDYIDLYQVHRPSPTTDVEETLGALTDLVHHGKVRYIGSSSYSASQIVEAQWVSRERNLARFVTKQPPYSILVRGIEEDILPTAQRHGMGTLVFMSAAFLQQRSVPVQVQGPAFGPVHAAGDGFPAGTVPVDVPMLQFHPRAGR